MAEVRILRLTSVFLMRHSLNSMFVSQRRTAISCAHFVSLVGAIQARQNHNENQKDDSASQRILIAVTMNNILHVSQFKEIVLLLP